MHPSAIHCTWLLLFSAVLPMAGDDPRWRMRDAVSAYMQEIQYQRERRIEARLHQGRINSDFVAFAAELCVPSSSTRLRNLGGVAQLSSNMNERRKLRLEYRDLWTRENDDGSLQQQWIITEHVHALKSGISFPLKYEWRTTELALIFEGQLDGQGGFTVRPLWNQEHRLSERLPPQLSRMLDLLSPDAHLLLTTALERPR